MVFRSSLAISIHTASRWVPRITISNPRSGVRFRRYPVASHNEKLWVHKLEPSSEARLERATWMP